MEEGGKTSPVFADEQTKHNTTKTFPIAEGGEKPLAFFQEEWEAVSYDIQAMLPEGLDGWIKLRKDFVHPKK